MSRAPDRPIAFVDLQAQRARIGARIDAAIARVLAHGAFVLGPEVGALEDRLAAYCGARHAVSCSSGTDALLLALMAKGIGPGDAVFVPAFSFPAPAEAAALLGATPVFVDVDRTAFTLDPASLAAAAEAVAGDRALRPAAVIVVDLYGVPGPYDAVRAIAEAHGMTVFGDAAQSFGAALGDARVGTLAEITATSFYPAKPLGCYGDGGCVFTDDDALAAAVRSLRVHGAGADRRELARIGINGRLDTLQAAVLLEKLDVFDDELARRAEIAARYEAALGDAAATPRPPADTRPAWACYTLVVERRDGIAARLARAGVPTHVYYPRPLHRQPAYAGYPAAPGGLPAAEWLAERVLSLPMHAYLDTATQDRITDAVRAALAESAAAVA